VLRVEATTTAGQTGDDQLRLSDVGKLARRARRKVVGAARADDQPAFGAMLTEHLGGGVEDLDVVEETWPMYDQVNVQAGLDAWLAEPGREHRLVGVVNFRHRDFGLSDLMRSTPPGFGPGPGNGSRVNQPSGPDGQVIACVQAGMYLVRDDDAALELGPLTIDRGARRVRVDGQPVHLTPTEFDLLVCLAERPGTVLTRESLMAQVWDWPDATGTRTVDSHVKSLRAKIGAERVRTVHGVGYALEPAAPGTAPGTAP
jgi:DNA-binding response OmpR family regulator